MWYSIACIACIACIVCIACLVHIPGLLCVGAVLLVLLV